jgi:PhzF family phenazine biosynthesis protein
MKYYVADAFTDTLFHGNPAGVCLPDKKISDAFMQHIASENNLAETAFLIREAGRWELKWFTPEVEMDLCGHATLAAAFVLMNYEEKNQTSISFETKSGTLTVTRNQDMYTMDFPSRKPALTATPALLEQALGCRVLETHLSRDLLALVESEEAVKQLHPDLALLSKLDQAFAVIVTAPGRTCDFVSRFFAPNAGIPEDPVTGSAHSTLIPFWSERLSKTTMTARQLSPRGGVLYCQDAGDRVKISGKAVCYLMGNLMCGE